MGVDVGVEGFGRAWRDGVAIVSEVELRLLKSDDADFGRTCHPDQKKNLQWQHDHIRASAPAPTHKERSNTRVVGVCVGGGALGGLHRVAR